MAVPDLSTLTDDEVAETIAAAKNERVRRGQFAEVNSYLRLVLGIARDAGVTKAKVSNVLTNIVNDVYSTPAP